MFGARLSLRSVYCRGRTLEIGVWHLKLQPVTVLIIYHLWQKSYSFHIHSIDKWYPFQIPSLQVPFVSLLTAVNALSLKNEQMTNQNILWTFWQPQNVSVYLFGPFYQPKWQIFQPFHQASTYEIPTLWYTSSLKKVPLSGRASPYRPL